MTGAERFDIRWGHWDYKKPRSLVSDYDLDVVAHSLRGPLHHVTNTPECKPSTPCVMCGNAMRLVVQSFEPRLVDAMLHRIASTLGKPFIDLNPRCGDD